MSDLFEGLSGIMKGLSGFMPKDDPNVKIMNAQSEINELRKKETEIYAEIGRQVLAEKTDLFPDLENKLQLVKISLQEAEQKLKSAQEEKLTIEAAKRLRKNLNMSFLRGTYNAEGIKFCQECGSRLGTLRCSGCGTELSYGTRYCGECGKNRRNRHGRL